MDTEAVYRSDRALLTTAKWRLHSVLLTLIAGVLAGCGDGDLTICGSASAPGTVKNVAPPEAVVTGVSDVIVMRRDASGSAVPVDEGGQVRVDELQFKVFLSYTIPARASAGSRFSVLNWFVSEAHACSQIIPTAFKSRVVGADLSSSASLGTGFDAGASLASSFLIRSDDVSRYSGSDGEPPPFQRLDEFGTPQAQEASSSYVLILDMAAGTRPEPTEVQSHRFAFSISLQNGDTFSGRSSAVQVLPATT